MSKISLRDVNKLYPVRGNGADALHALSDINLDVADGEFMAIVGPSGCGKSSLLDLLCGLAEPSSGEIRIDGKPLRGAGLDRGIVFQQYALFPWLTALGNVEFGLQAAGIAKPERRARAREFLALVGLSVFENRFPHELSGGMKQRVAIARSLSYNPDVLLMDEPFAALDAQTRETLQDELLDIWEKTRKTIIFITHGIDEAVYLGQRVAIMSARPGRIVDVIDVPRSQRNRNEDRRADPAFVATRHRIWSLLRHSVDSQPLANAA
jgi:NitT/TauT family transport system ATP-binding protein